MKTETDWLTVSTEKIPSWETNSCSGSQEIPRNILKPECSLRHSLASAPPPLTPTLSQINPVHDPTHFLNIHFNIFFPSTPRSSVVFFPQVSPPQPCKHLPSPHTCYISRQSHSSLFHHPNSNICWGVHNIKLLIMYSSPLPWYFFPLRPSPPQPCKHLPSPHTCYISRQSHSSLFHHPNNNICWGVHNIKLLMT